MKERSVCVHLIVCFLVFRGGHFLVILEEFAKGSVVLKAVFRGESRESDASHHYVALDVGESRLVYVLFQPL